MDWLFNFITAFYAAIGLIVMVSVVILFAVFGYLKCKGLKMLQKSQDCMDMILAALLEEDEEKAKEAMQEMNKSVKEANSFVNKWMKK